MSFWCAAMTLMKLRSGLLDLVAIFNSDCWFRNFPEQGDLKYFWVIFNNFWVIATSPRRYNLKFSKLNWEKIAQRHLLKSQKYWKSVSVSQISHHNTFEFLVWSCLFVLYLWSSYCGCLIKLLMKWAHFINNYHKSILGGPRKKQFVFQSCFLCIT